MVYTIVSIPYRVTSHPLLIWVSGLNLILLQALDHIINSAAKSNYMSAGQISVPIVFRGPNGAAAGVGAQHSQVRIQFLYVGNLLHILRFPCICSYGNAL